MFYLLRCDSPTLNPLGAPVYAQVLHDNGMGVRCKSCGKGTVYVGVLQIDSDTPFTQAWCGTCGVIQEDEK
jgi:hypothetical protein